MKKILKANLNILTICTIIFFIFYLLKQEIENDRKEDNLKKTTSNINSKKVKTQSTISFKINDTIKTNNIFSSIAK